eukprot:372108-Rhodomonas_salina.1
MGKWLRVDRRGSTKEKYFLLVRLQDKDFMWTFPSTTRAAPELLLQDFVDLTGIVPATIRCDNEFGENQSLLHWAKKFGVTVCPTPAYNHTMAARIKGSVCIVKEHLRCMVKATNAPLRFW